MYSMIVQKSRSFILPMLDLPRTDFVINTYMGSVDYEGDNTWGDYFYILCNIDLPIELRNMICKHKQYRAEFYVSEDEVIYVFDLTEIQKLTIVAPFLRGEYSKINSEYFFTHFRKEVSPGKKSKNWMIYHKDEVLKRGLEEALDVQLPEGAEVCARPLKENEVHNFDITLESIDL